MAEGPYNKDSVLGYPINMEVSYMAAYDVGA
jgi:hypothetical protein